MFSPARQSGVALITALMIVAIASIISASIATKVQLDVRRTGNIIANDQARLYTLAAEELAKRYLLEDSKNNNIDHLEEDWAQAYIFPLEDGTLQAQLTDLQACINLNAIAADPVVKARFSQLLDNADLPTHLVQAVIDWIDKDQDTTIPDGAEDNYYTGLEDPYRTANTHMASISELKLIKGFEKKETIQALEANICAFGDNTTNPPINVNTAPLEVLLSLSNKMDAGTAENIIQYRAETPFNKIDEFKSFDGLDTIIPTTTNLSVSTNYFMLETKVTIGKAHTTMFSILHRDKAKGSVSILSRSQGVF